MINGEKRNFDHEEWLNVWILKSIHSIDICQVTAGYFEYNLCGKCCARCLERVLRRDKDGDLFLKDSLFVKEVVINE